MRSYDCMFLCCSLKSAYRIAGLWDRYTGVFESVWAASAFKGATGASAYVTDVGYHVDNHKGWLELQQSRITTCITNFRGYCLTGWQRYGD